ncbi:carbamoyltransferase N-terminal domain-containing protein [Bradyrhizobium sp. ORS 285]|uniref:carbamoyltransferase N-terminal domain-containing protein n=1 Tax=Bradyrhizobium sp. ORS 285 TaxID=115808 RepID=UPI00031A11AD|nr:carbamoyltransferase N-terminal domain-containing protein [Bradyrhizobium sp. ORS 285]
MRICGIKLTHDGSVAVVDDGRLVFCQESEKRNNNPRYEPIHDLDEIRCVLVEHGIVPEQIDRFVIDGWDGASDSRLKVSSSGSARELIGAPYFEGFADGVLLPYEGMGLELGGKAYGYSSYPHTAGHVSAAYCTSPFLKADEPALCLVWDGCIFPRLYHVGPNGARFLENLFPIIGHAYAVGWRYFGPNSRSDQEEWDLGAAGKLMAYIALGEHKDEITEEFENLYRAHFAGHTSRAIDFRVNFTKSQETLQATHRFFEESKSRLRGERSEDVLSSFHVFIERLLVQEIALCLLRRKGISGSRNLCVAGGCGLNIKWNSALRSSGLFDMVWVPPFPNDSGSAIGAACAENAARSGFRSLEWSVYCGPTLKRSRPSREWESVACSLDELAAIIAGDQPVVFLSGRAELGPRALGGRSILAAATSPTMKQYLNEMKSREEFRPVAPICIEDRASEIFSPGTPDPYMLFDHQTREEWRAKVPSIVHLDGSARLQTVARTSTHHVAQLLVEYERLTGIPLLCNTSANYHGRGFFPDVSSACEWGRIDHVWSDGQLWRKRVHTRCSAESELERVGAGACLT